MFFGFPVGNIPYDASEEKLKDVFSEVGPVLSFKLVYDRESGKPKGYGFCEYRDQETASSAMRNLNGFELNGRNLRVDTATNERFKEEIKNLQTSLTGNSFESIYGSDVEPEKAPEAIAKVVASLQPEQMYEIARQMKHCVLTNTNEARNMLIQNPQLAYALLQALVMMRVIDVNAASNILYKPNPPPVVIPPANIGPVPTPVQNIHPPHNHLIPPNQPAAQPAPMMPPVHQNIYDPHDHPNNTFNRPMTTQHQNFDQRHNDPRLRPNDPRPNEMFDPRIAPPPTAAPMDPRIRHLPPQQSAPPPIRPAANAPAPIASTAAASLQPRMPTPIFNQPGTSFGLPTQQPTNVTVPAPNTAGIQPPLANQANQSEQEKAQLIMQVLALSDQQIAMLPNEQRQSIMLLKEQLARGAQK